MKCNLKVLCVITIFENKDYLDGDRWERLISDYLPEISTTTRTPVNHQQLSKSNICDAKKGILK
ncbi:unnamed protein product, partial [Rotaria sp. Silwood1]